MLLTHLRKVLHLTPAVLVDPPVGISIADVPKCTSLLDAMQVVPQLLQSCITCCGGIRPLRLLCKSASVIAVRAVRNYCIKLSPQASVIEPLLGVAGLLEHTRLQHVRVEITVPAGAVNLKIKSSTSHELASHIAQLQQFVDIMRPALSTATTLEIYLTFTPCVSTTIGSDPTSQNMANTTANTSNAFQTAINPTRSTSGSSSSASQGNYKRQPYIPGCLTEAAGIELGLLLAATCPNTTQLGVGRGVNEKTLQVLGANLPNLTFLEIQDGAFPVDLFGGILHQLLPCVTHLRLACVQYISGHQAYVCKLAELTFLTSLDLGAWLHYGRDWLHLPGQLKEICCEQLPFEIPNNLHLDLLVSVKTSDKHTSHICVEYLASLLKAAPSLALLSSWRPLQTNICIGACSPATLECLHILHRRMVSGLSLRGIDVTCGRDGGGSNVDMDEALHKMPRPMSFTSCVLKIGWGRERSYCFSALCKVLPQLESLHLASGQLDFDSHANVMFDCLSLLVAGSVLSSEAILRLIPCMPQLKELRHDLVAINVHSLQFQVAFQARLQAASQARKARNISLGFNTEPDIQRFGDWRLKEDGGSFLVWGRNKVIRGETSPV